VIIRIESSASDDWSGISLLTGLVYLGSGIVQVNLGWIAGGLVFLYAEGVGIPRLRRRVTFHRLSNVSFWDRVIGRGLFFLLALVGIGLAVGSTPS
jgi:hypothetical protein